jgi:hypothetical protein
MLYYRYSKEHGLYHIREAGARPEVVHPGLHIPRAT